MLLLCINYSRDIIKRKLGPYMLNTSELSGDLESGHIHIKAAKKKKSHVNTVTPLNRTPVSLAAQNALTINCLCLFQLLRLEMSAK